MKLTTASTPDGQSTFDTKISNGVLEMLPAGGSTYAHNGSGDTTEPEIQQSDSRDCRLRSTGSAIGSLVVTLGADFQKNYV